MDQAPILFRPEGAVAWITLNRPERLNALSEEMRLGLGRALDDIERSPEIRVIIVTGSGRAFSAGGDLGEFRADIEHGNYAETLEKVAAAGKLLERIEQSPRPVIAAVNGIAVAGGLEIILCCDLVIAAAGAKIGDGHLKYGVLPGGGGSIRLHRKLPTNRANELLLTAELHPAETLADWGLVNLVVPHERLLETARELGRQIAKLSPLGLKHIKDLARQATGQPLASALDNELDVFSRYLRSPDFREGLNAFAEKREPVFPNR